MPISKWHYVRYVFIWIKWTLIGIKVYQIVTKQQGHFLRNHFEAADIIGVQNFNPFEAAY